MERPAARPATGPAPGARDPLGALALTLIAASLGCFFAAAVAGPSVVSHELAGGALLPPYSLDLRPGPWLVVALLWAGTAAGAGGTWLALRALRAGWSPEPRKLLTAAAIATVAFAVVPPVNSDDVYSYAAYGRIAALGRDPYTTAPSELPDDPVTRAVTPPWRDTPTVYGPIATAEQAVVMRLAGRSVRWGVLGLAALGAVAFLATAALLDRYAADAAGRRRAAVCWALNPLVLFQLIGGAHLDTIGVVALVAAVVLLGRGRAIEAGAAIGAAVAVKLTGGVAAIGLAWAARRDLPRLGRLVATAALVVVALYLAAGGGTALTQARRSARFVSHGSWWRPIAVRLDAAFGAGSSRPVLSALALVGFAGLAWLLWRGLPPAAAGVPAAARHALAATIAWLLTTTYSLPWYSAWAWPLLALVVASHWDDVLLAWTAVLTLAYIPGRDVPLPAGLDGITRWLRAGFGPTALAVLLIAAVVLAVRSAKAQPMRRRTFN